MVSSRDYYKISAELTSHSCTYLVTHRERTISSIHSGSIPRPQVYPWFFGQGVSECRISKCTSDFSDFEKGPHIGCKDAQRLSTTIYHMDLSLPAWIKAHPLFHFQLATPRKAVMKAVAKEHSDVTGRLQTQTVNSTLWVACHRHQLPRESQGTWLSQPSAWIPTNTTINHSHPPTPNSYSYLSCTDLCRDGIAVSRN